MSTAPMSTESTKPRSKGRRKEKTTNEEECEQVHDAIKRWKAHDGAVLIPVVRKSSVAMMKEKAKPRWWKLEKSAKSTLCITTPDHLQREIDNTANDGQVHELFLLISRQVDLPELHFDVPTGIENLYIIRCTSPTSKRTSPSDTTTTTTTNITNSNKLILNGTSTFCNIRLDEWQLKRPDTHHNLILGPGVVIQLLGLGIPWTARDAVSSISKQQREEVAAQLRAMCDARLEGAGPQWEQWRGPVNKLLDVAAGTASASQVVECYANGIVVQAAAKAAEFGMEGMLKVGAGLLCVSGPGQIAVAGVAVAAAVYFVPWDTVWAWFRARFGALLSWILRAWENLKSWVASAAMGKAQAVVGKQGVEMRVRPMVTAG